MEHVIILTRWKKDLDEVHIQVNAWKVFQQLPTVYIMSTIALLDFETLLVTGCNIKLVVSPSLINVPQHH